MKRLIAALLAILLMIPCAIADESAGIWCIRHYVDDWGDPTDQPYVTNNSYIRGTFSNSATEGSALNVDFLIDKNNIAIRLYEYAGRNPVKAYSDTNYTIQMKDKNGSTYTISAREREGGDRLFIKTQKGYDLFIQALKQKGKLKFIIERNGRLDKYSFAIDDTSGFEAAYKKLLSLDFGIWHIEQYQNTARSYVVNAKYIDAVLEEGDSARKSARTMVVVDDGYSAAFIFDLKKSASGKTQWDRIVTNGDEVYSIVASGDGNRKTFTGVWHKGQDRMLISGENREKLLSTLEARGKVSFVCTRKEGSRVFSFTINDTSGFENAYQALLNNDE